MMTTLANWMARSAAAVFPSVVTRLPAPPNVIFLTFDDGPSPYTGHLLDLLEATGTETTFFLRGSRIEQYPELSRRIASSQHGIGNHSYHHLDAWRHRWSDVLNDLNAGSSAVEKLTGERANWMRPPFGRFRRKTLNWCRDHGERLTLWDVMAADFVEQSRPDVEALRIKQSVRSGSIVVLHDGQEHQPAALHIAERVISELSEAGWSLRRLPGLSAA